MRASSTAMRTATVVLVSFVMMMAALPVGAAEPVIPPCPLAGGITLDFPDTSLVSHRTAAHAQSTPVPVALQPGSYHVTLASYDHLAEGNDQPNEQWFLVGLSASGAITFQTAAISDIPGDVNSQIEDVGVIVADTLTTAVVAQHAAYPDKTSTNSVFPWCAKLVPDTPTNVRPTQVGLVDPATGVWRLRAESGDVTQFYYGNPGDIPFMGDWDCDGVDTPGLFRQSDAYAYLRNSNSQGVADIRFFFGNPSDIPLAGDFNGDGCDTVSIYRPSEQRFYIINKLGANDGGLGAADYWFLFGNPGDKPVVGDWDGDGIDEVGLHRESSGYFYYRNSLTTGIADGQFFFGDPGDRFVAGDWGLVDYVETPALFRPANTTFYFRHTNSQGTADSQFIWTSAAPGWLPVAGSFGLD